MKRLLSLILSLVFLCTTVVSLSSCGRDLEHSYTPKENEVYVRIEVKKYGRIDLCLDRAAAPITVDNFVSLVEDGFYDGLTFHRVVNGFVIQGGDPSGDGTGDSATKIEGEFSANGYENPIRHERGVISMARSDSYNSASCQFFIVHQTSKNNSLSLDGKYAAFGRVVSGMEVVDAIVADAQYADAYALYYSGNVSNPTVIRYAAVLAKGTA